MTGQKFGMLSVIENSGQRRKSDGAVLWRVICECGKEKFLPRCLLIKYKSCGCKKADIQSKSLRLSLNRGGCGDIYATHWNSVKKNAKQRGLAVDIDVSYVWDLFLKQNRKCALTGVDLVFSKRCWSHDATASLDRINSDKGYIKGNVQWVHKIVNFMKQQFDQTEFIGWCEKIVNHHQNHLNK